MSIEPWKDDDPEIVALNAILDKLSDHWENIQVFLSRINPDPKNEEDSGCTQLLVRGRGNHYARTGQVKEWLITEDEKTRQEARDKYREENGGE